LQKKRSNDVHIIINLFKKEKEFWDELRPSNDLKIGIELASKKKKKKNPTNMRWAWAN
jgi:hypothetical protein